MATVSKRIEKGSPLGRRDTLRMSGTGCICSVPEYREVSKGDDNYSFLHARVVSNSVRKNKDGSADQFSEFTDVVLSGNRAKALAKVLSKGQIVEFSGKGRTRSFDSDRYFDKDGKPAQIYRTECNIGQDGWINIMKDAAEGKGEKASLPAEGTAVEGNDVAALAAQMKALMTAIQQGKVPQEAPAEEAGSDEVPF